jgi:predicted HAD superfamily phosphohydrolase YqeG
VAVNKQEGRIPRVNPRVLMVGDRYLTDIVAGNLAGIETARVIPYKPFSEDSELFEDIGLKFSTYFDSAIGAVMSRLARK